MSPALLSIKMKSFPAPFIFVKRSMTLTVAAAFFLVMSSEVVARRHFGVYLSAVKKSGAWIVIALVGFTIRTSFAGDCNDLILEQIQKMPQGGRYSVSHFAK